MDSSIPTSKADVLEYIRRALAPGALYHGAIKAILQEQDYDAAYGDAVIWFIEKCGEVKESSVVLSSGTIEYDVPSDMDRLVRFIPPGNNVQGMAYTGFGFENTGIPMDMVMGNGMPLSDFTMGLQQIETLNHTFGTGWYGEFDPKRRKLRVMPPGATGTAKIHYVSNDLTFSDLQIWQRRMVRDYALASAKSRLGTIYSKYDNIEGASGTVSLTQRLQDDASLEKQQLNDEISQRYEADLIFTG